MNKYEQQRADERMREEIARLQNQIASDDFYRNPAFWRALGLVLAAFATGAVLASLLP
jgi:hypothetical protein